MSTSTIPSNKKSRLVRRAAFAGGSLLIAALALAFWIVRSGAFQDYLRRALISRLEHETNSRVEIARFQFSFPGWHVHLGGLVIHGTESAGAAPLLTVDTADFDLPLLTRPLAIAHLRAVHPQVHVSVFADGKTTLPHLTLDRLQLAIGHLALERGVFVLNNLQHAFDVRAENVAASLIAGQLHLSSRPLHFQSECCGQSIAELTTDLTLHPDSATIQSLSLQTADKIRFSAQGSITHFADPAVALRFESGLPAAALRTATPGTLALYGSAIYDAKLGLRADGHVAAQGLAWQARATSLFTFSGDRLNLRNLFLESPRGNFKGEATLAGRHRLAINGRLERVPLPVVLAVLHFPALPLDASVSGPVLLETDLGQLLARLSLRTKLHLTPGRSPLSGDVLLAKQPGSPYELGSSRLDLAQTHLAFQGVWNADVQIALSTTDLTDFGAFTRAPLPVQLLPRGSAQFNGHLRGSAIEGDLGLHRFMAEGEAWDTLTARGTLAANALQLVSLRANGPSGQLSTQGESELTGWQFTPENRFSIQADVDGLQLPFGRLTAVFRASGTRSDPAGRGHIMLENATFRGRSLRRITADAALANGLLTLEHGTLAAIPTGSASFSGNYQRAGDWHTGRLSLRVAAHDFPAATLDPRLEGQLEARGEAELAIDRDTVRPLSANGNAAARELVAAGTHLGALKADFVTHNDQLHLTFANQFEQGALTGSSDVQLVPGLPARGQLEARHVTLALAGPLSPHAVLSSKVDFQGPLEHPDAWNASLRISELVLNSPGVPFELHNAAPWLLRLTNGTLEAQSIDLSGPETNVHLAGSVAAAQPWNAHLDLDGAVNLQLARLFNPTLLAQGQAQIHAAIRGRLDNPRVTGRVQLVNAGLTTPDVPSGISNLNGVVTFDQSRATVERLSATAGGGSIRAGGFVSYGGGVAPSFHLDAQSQNVRVRSASNISLTATTDLHLSGTATSSLLSGSATISRVVFNPYTDVGTVLSNFAVPLPTPVNRKDFLSNLHLDVSIQSAPNLQLSTSLSRDVEAEIDLRLRGTPDHPLLLGSLSANQGDIRVFGSRYSINRGEVTFTNTNRIDPVLDLDLQTQARGITVDITLAGTLSHLNITYRSDPPLQPRDIIALLTVGRTPQEAANTQNTQIVNDTTAFHSGTNTVLGQAIAPSTNRLSKLFGITNIKIDPLVQGITNTPQARLTLEQQISRAITVTYVTNLSQTSEQIFRLEWSLNRQYSLVAVRDDNGEFGIDIQFKKRFR